VSDSDRLDEIAKLLAILVSRERNLQEAVAELSAVEIAPKRIAELLGTTPGYVQVAIARAKKQARKKPAPQT
jgi:DNA-directed RNA polymerase specialized sigma24 family protein